MTKSNENICKNCILPNGFLGIELNNDGDCNFCADPTHKNNNWSKRAISDEDREDGLKDWYACVLDMQNNKERNEFDCVIGYSGGKDSTALVDTFINEYNLNPLCVTVDTGFMTDVAKNNIKQTLAKMNLEQNYVYIGDAAPVYAKLYKKMFLKHNSNSNSLTVKLCEYCTKLIHTVVMKEAIKRDLPYVIFGFSPDQIRQYFYETSTEEIIEDGTPPEEIAEVFDEADLEWYLTSEEKQKNIPRMLYPYHVIEYSEAEVIERIERKGYIEKGKGDPILTNCHVVMAGLMYDLFRYGGLTYALQYAELIRQAPEEQHKLERKKWMRLYSNVGRQILNGTFSTDRIELFLEKTGINREDLMKDIQDALENDPNKEQIKFNLELLKNRKFR